MTIVSVGYAGTITDTNYRRMAVDVFGSLYGVDDYSSFRVTPGVGDRALALAPGGAFGLGVYDRSDAVETLTGASVASGSRWDLVVLRRTWGTKTTVPLLVTGTSTKALPSRNTGFDGVNDQPIALVRFAAGQTAVQEIVDLRCIPGTGGLVAFDDLARSYLDRVGTSVRIGDQTWDRVVDALGSPAWVATGRTRHAILRATRGQQFNGGQADFSQWSFDATGSYRTSDEFYQDQSYLRMRAPGRYRARGSMYVQGGSGIGVVGFWIQTGTGQAFTRVQAKPLSLLQGYGQIAEFEVPSVMLTAGGGIALTSDQGQWLIGGDATASNAGTYLYLEHLGAA